MRLDALLQTLAVRAFSDCFGTDLEAGQFSVQKTRSEFPGDRTIVCFPLARFSKVAPDATADALGQALVNMDGPVTGHNVVKGFLNLELDPSAGARVPPRARASRLSPCLVTRYV